MTRRNLNAEERFKVCSWITTHRQESEEMTDPDGAKACAEDLKFSMTPSNFAACRKAVGIVKRRPSGQLVLRLAKGSKAGAAQAAVIKLLVAVAQYLHAKAQGPPAAEPYASDLSAAIRVGRELLG